MTAKSFKIYFLTLLATSQMAGCVLLPADYEREKAGLDAQSLLYEKDFSSRAIPELGARPSTEELLIRGFYVSGEIEAAYQEWSAAMIEVRESGAYPNAPLQLDFEYMFSGEQLKSWDRSTFILQPNPNVGLMLPQKIEKRAEIAFSRAKIAGEKFRQAKLSLQKELIGMWVEYGLLAKKIKVQEESLGLLKVMLESSRNSLEVGEKQIEYLKVNLEVVRVTNEIENLRAELRQMQGTLNGLLAREAATSLDPPPDIPVLEELQLTDEEVLRLGTEKSPELQTFLLQVEGKEKELELAGLEFVPDFMPMFGFTGAVSQIVGGSLSLASSYSSLKSMESRLQAELKAAQAMYREKRNTSAAKLVATLLALRNSERNTKTLQGVVLPAARALTKSAGEYYAVGLSDLFLYLDSLKSSLEIELMLADVQKDRDQQLLELEVLLGEDLVVLSKQVPDRS